MNKKLHYVVGTDTGVGKTEVMKLALEAAANLHLPIRPLKPVHSGWPKQDALGEDLQAWKPWVSQEEALSFCRYRFEAAISPFSASDLEQEKIELDQLTKFLDQHLQESSLLVEGVGGVMCPLGPGQTWLDLMALRPAPCWLVVGLKLGCLNHTLMSLKALESHGVPVQALILNSITPEMDLASERTRWELEQLCSVPCVGPLNYGKSDENIRILEELIKVI